MKVDQQTILFAGLFVYQIGGNGSRLRPGSLTRNIAIPNSEHGLATTLVWMRSYDLRLRATLEPQRGEVRFIVKTSIGLGDLRLCLL